MRPLSPPRPSHHRSRRPPHRGRICYHRWTCTGGREGPVHSAPSGVLLRGCSVRPLPWLSTPARRAVSPTVRDAQGCPQLPPAPPSSAQPPTRPPHPPASRCLHVWALPERPPAPPLVAAIPTRPARGGTFKVPLSCPFPGFQVHLSSELNDVPVSGCTRLIDRFAHRGTCLSSEVWAGLGGGPSWANTRQRAWGRVHPRGAALSGHPHNGHPCAAPLC